MLHNSGQIYLLANKKEITTMKKKNNNKILK